MTIDERIEAYLEKMPPCVAGNGGDSHLYKVACVLYNGFALSEEQTIRWLEHFNEKCEPPWEHHRLEHKAKEAAKAVHVKARGHLLDRSVPARVVFMPTAIEAKVLSTYVMPRKSLQIRPETEETHSKPHLTVLPPIPSTSRQFIRVSSLNPSHPSHGWKSMTYGSLALDIETYAEIRLGKHGRPLKSRDALSAQKGDIRLVQMADLDGNIFVRDHREKPLTLDEMAAIESQEVIAHNAAFELRFLGFRLGVVASKVFCTMTASRLLHPGREPKGFHGLGSVLERELGVKIPKDLGSSDWGAMILTEEQMEYARNDVRYLHRLKDKLEKELLNKDLKRVFDMECKLILIVAAMEVHGFTIDAGAMRALKAVSDTDSANLAAQIRQDFGDEKLNPASNVQLKKAFIEAGEKIENVDEETLMRLDDPRAKTILQYRTAAKLSSNIETLLKWEHRGRIHSQFKPFGTTTGRFSSADPNLQNVTRGPLRACFVPSAPDRKLIVADYSQIELRVAAFVAGDQVMIDAFKTGEDLHHKTAASALGREITKLERNQVGKATNFGFIYGQGADGFVRYARTNYELILTCLEADGFRSNFFSLYGGLKEWHSRCWELAENPANNSARTIFGRLLLPEGDRKWHRFVMFTNYRVQGSCADLIKAAMIKTVSVLPKDVCLVATVHDELIFDAPADKAEQYRDLIHQAMVDAFVEMFGETVPVEVEAKVCDHWGDK